VDVQIYVKKSAFYLTNPPTLYSEDLKMPHTAKLLIANILFLLSAAVFAAPDDMKPYPPAEQGYKRMVIRLQPLDNEANHKVELMIGKTMKVDCNKHWFLGQLSEAIAQGWGFTYFKLGQVTGPASTRMACPPDQKPQDSLVKLQSAQGLLAYNSKLPVVVYVPNDFEVHYRIWTATEESLVAKSE